MPAGDAAKSYQQPARIYQPADRKRQPSRRRIKCRGTRQRLMFHCQFNLPDPKPLSQRYESYNCMDSPEMKSELYRQPRVKHVFPNSGLKMNQLLPVINRDDCMTQQEELIDGFLMVHMVVDACHSHIKSRGTVTDFKLVEL